jgi:predicted enzyme related to lactoylglutathione lyase
MLQSLNFVLVHVPNLMEARRFYTGTLGLVIEAEQPGFVQFKRPDGSGATFALLEDATASPFQHVELWWAVEDVDATHAALVARGVAITDPPTDMPFGRTLGINDPAGNTLHLWRPR